MGNSSVCPWWLGYLLASPIRKLINNPEKMLGKYLKPGMRVVDYGSGMGYFSLPMARMVGSSGKVYCFDIQVKMLEHLAQRAARAGLGNIIEPRLILPGIIEQEGLNPPADFALLFAVAHEVPDRKRLFRELACMLRPQGLLLFSEPKGHVSMKDFEESIYFAVKAGFKRADVPQDPESLTVLLEKI
ncbi:MAG: class I SAM-dependent methyltransferase [Bacteroidota bacterium]